MSIRKGMHLLLISNDLLKGTKGIQQKPNVNCTDIQSFQTWVKLNFQGAQDQGNKKKNKNKKHHKSIQLK